MTPTTDKPTEKMEATPPNILSDETYPNYAPYNKFHEYNTQTPLYHKCKQENRLDRLEKRNDNIDTKLDQIWSAIQAGDNRNTMYVIMAIIAFIGALSGVFVAFMVFFK